MHRFDPFRFSALALALVLAPRIARSAAEQPASVAAPIIPTLTVNLTEFGARGDGATLNTEAFARAISALSEKGGGRLVVPPGLWLTGPIRLRSKINLHLEPSALIRFSGDYKLYPLTVIDLRGEKEVDSTSPISGESLADVAITGAGILDGGGDVWRPVKRDKLTDRAWRSLTNSGGCVNAKGDTWWPSQAALDGEAAVAKLRASGSLDLAAYQAHHPFLRPKMLRIIGCQRLLIEGVTFQNPPNWTINPVLCEDVSILNLKVFNAASAQNSDALDLESCRRAVVRGCIFDVGDDGICLKSGKDAPGRRIGVPTEDVLIEDCTVYYGHGGFTIGSEMSGGVRNVRVRNCTFLGTLVGLRFKSTRGRGGVVENIRISDIRMADIGGDAINFNLYYGGKAPNEETAAGAETAPPPVTEATPQFRDILIENVVCRGAQNALVLQGLPEMPLREIILKDVAITARKGATLTDAEKIVFDNVRLETQTGEPVKALRVKHSNLNLAK